MIDIRNVTKIYKGPVVANDDISLSIPAGSVFGMLGPNGAGKSTLVHQMLGLLRPTRGEIRIAGIDAAAHPQRVKELYGFMPQTRLAMRELRVRDALYYSARLRHVGRRAARSAADDVIDRLGLAEHAGKEINRLSGGLHRMACFGMALVGSPQLLVLDEPTNDLDPVRRRTIWETIRELNATERTTVVLITHNVLEAERVVDRVAMISNGRLIAHDTPGALKRRVDGHIRLEFMLKEDGPAGDFPPYEPSRSREAPGIEAPAIREALAQLGRISELGPHHLVLFAEPKRLGDTVEQALAILGSRLDDFRIAPPTLEDVYIQLQGEKISGQVAQ